MFCLLQALVDVLAALVYHCNNGRETLARQYEVDHQECQQHPEEESEFRS